MKQKQITKDNFLSYYRLKKELIDFCREHNLPQAGSKEELTQRIEQFLATGTISQPKKVSSKCSNIDLTNLTQKTIIRSGLKLSSALRAFFIKEIGPKFHFNRTVRDFIKYQQGKTLGDAIDAWHKNDQNPQKTPPIDSQFEYNRHIREYFKTDPGATLRNAIAAWEKIKKIKR